MGETWQDFNWASADVTLGIVVDSINTNTEPDMGRDITLIVNGAVLSGTLIPAWRWFELQASEDEEDFFRDQANELLAQAKAQKESFEVPAEQWTKEHENAHDSFGVHAHLKDARLWIAPGMNMPKALWRVRLSQIGAWHFGSLADGDPQ